MSNSNMLNQDKWRIIDQSVHVDTFHAMQSFAYDDTLCTSVGKEQSPAVTRTWVHEKTIVLGIQDAKLPYLEEGLAFLASKGYRCVIRNSGGLAVVLDNGVLNISLIFPDTEKGIDINRGYETMYVLIQKMFADMDVNIEAREIVGSYCPGSYDLSIYGKKFAGISQRRVRKGVAVQIYLCVNGSGEARAQLIQQFYELGLQGEETKFSYPRITPHVMASLSDLLQTPLTISDVMVRLLQQLQKHSNHLFNDQLSSDELETYIMNYQRMIERNEKILTL